MALRDGRWIAGRKKWLIGGAALVLVAAVLGWRHWHVPQQYDNQAEISLGQPDGWIHSQNLALLPHDLLQEPLLKSLLTEDFLYFYAQDDDWLSLQGALRRLNFERSLNISDSLLKDVAAAPTDVYLWHDGSHALGYWALSMQRGYLQRFLTALAQIKLTTDKQISEIGRVKIGSYDIPLLKIALSAQRSIILVTHSDRLVLFSDSAMLTRDQGELDPHAEALIQTLFSDNAATRNQLIASEQAPKLDHDVAQTLWFSNRFFAQGYAAFLPDVQALRFDYDGKVWTGQAAVQHVHVDDRIWRQVPAYAAACFSSSVDWKQASDALKNAHMPVDSLLTDHGLTALSPTSAVCWFNHGDSSDDTASDNESYSLATPLLIALRTPQSTLTPTDMHGLFDWAIAHNRNFEKPVLELKAQRRSVLSQLIVVKADLKSYKADHAKEKHKGMSADEIKANDEDFANNVKQKKDTIDQLDEQSDDLKQKIKDVKEQVAPDVAKATALTQEKQGSFTTLRRTMPIRDDANPMLAFNDQVIYFSPDHKLVERAMQVAEQHYPNVLEQAKIIDPAKNTVLYLHPARVATLLTQTGNHALSADTDRQLRSAFDYHMPTRMTALKQYPPFTVTIDNPTTINPTAVHWQPIHWSLTSQTTAADEPEKHHKFWQRTP